jgi:hypothetical protein
LDLINVGMSYKTLVKNCTYVSGLHDIVKNKVISYIGHTTSTPTNIHLTRVEDHNALDIALEHPPRVHHGEITIGILETT